jgi:acyl-CoA thioesterase YciA
MKERPRCEPALRISMTPQELNIHETVFGGAIVSYIDLAGAVQCRREGCRRAVTVSIDKVIFKEPVFKGDVVSFYAETKRIGNTSMTVRVEVWADRFEPPFGSVWVTEAELTFVNVGEDRKPMPIPRAGRETRS